MTSLSLNVNNNSAPAVGEPQRDEEVELTATPSVSTDPVVEATAQETKQNFEWNVGKLYSSEAGKSAGRTWAVRILSTFLVFPLVFTAIADTFRRIAFAAGLVDGKSFSLIDKASEGVKAVANKVSAVYQSYNKPKTTEELNKQSQKAIKAQANKLVDGFKALNGGYLGTNSSFSSPTALNAEKQIEKAKVELTAEIKAYVARNASGTENFLTHLNVARDIVSTEINAAAGNEPYIENKIERSGPRPFIRTWANQELDIFLDGNSQIAHQFIDLARQEPDFAAGLKRGVDAEILTQDQAEIALKKEVHAIYEKGLETGLDAANESTEAVLNSAKKNEVVTKEKAVSIEKSIHAEVEVLAAAAAKDVARKMNSETTDVAVTQMLIKAADGLKQKKKLKPEDETRFLTAAKAQLSKAKEAVEAEALRQKQQADEIQAKQVAEVQKAADQSSLLGKFIGMLGLINQKQVGLTALFVKNEELETQRQTITDSLETIRTTQVSVRGVPMTILQAADEHYRARILISNSKLSTEAKKQQIKDLEAKDFGKQTIDKINEMKILDPQLDKVIDLQAELSQDIDAKHEELAMLISKYKVYRKNNLAGLEKRNHEMVVKTEKTIDTVQKTLDQRHRQLTQPDMKLIDRLRPAALRVVNLDPEANRAEVEALVTEFEKPLVKEEGAAPEVEEVAAPDAPSKLEIARRVMTSPYNAFSAWNANRKKPAAPSA